MVSYVVVFSVMKIVDVFVARQYLQLNPVCNHVFSFAVHWDISRFDSSEFAVLKRVIQFLSQTTRSISALEPKTPRRILVLDTRFFLHNRRPSFIN